jgi:hypothetical protein
MLGSSTFRYVRHFLRISTEREPALVLSSLMGLVGMYQSPLSLSLSHCCLTHSPIVRVAADEPGCGFVLLTPTMRRLQGKTTAHPSSGMCGLLVLG